ncbi:MAG: hypothetical protein WD845_00190 [Pirellulales bacterium]
MRRSSIPLLNLVIFVVSEHLVLAEPPSAEAERVAIAPFVPVDDLIAQVDYFVGRMDEALASPQAFDLAAQSRVMKDANTLAALALVLSLYDEDFPRRAAMPALLRGAQQLAVSEADFEKSSQALADIKRAQAGHVDPAAGAKWEGVASLSVLMKQVPVIHSRLNRGVDRRRLARQATQSAGESATLAAIAQASMIDTSYAKTAAQADEWRRQCEAMRDAAGEVNAAVHAQDFERVSAGMKRLVQSCEACHATFRRP